MFAFQTDSYLKTLKATVLNCSKWTGEDSARLKTKKSKKKKDFFQVELSDTVLFAEGGGQPSDVGTIGRAACSFIKRSPDGKILHKTDKPFNSGDEVEIKVDWTKRFDHMQQHSGQHLISAIAMKKFGYKTDSWWLSEYPSPSYIELLNNKSGASLSEQELAPLENEINEIIADARPMNCHILYNEKEVNTFAQGNPMFKPKELPEGSGPVRVIEIEGVEFNSCCGTHLSKTSELQSVKFTSISGGKGTTKLFFLAGSRVLHALDASLRRDEQLKGLLTCQPSEFEKNVTKLKETQKELMSANRMYQKLLVKSTAAEILSVPGTFYQHYDDLDSGFLANVGYEVTAEDPDKLLVFTFGPRKSAKFLIFGPEKILSKGKKEFTTIVEGRGGGKGNKMQGNLKNVKAVPEAIEKAFGSAPAKANSSKSGDSKPLQVEENADIHRWHPLNTFS